MSSLVFFSSFKPLLFYHLGFPGALKASPQGRPGGFLASSPLIQPFYSDLDCCCLCCRSNVIMTHTLTAFMELMDHGIVSWENLSSTFIKKVLSQRSSRSLMKSVLSLSHAPSFFACLVFPQIAGYVNAKPTDASIQQVSLDILESMVLSSFGLFLQVKQEVTMERLIAHLQV